MTKELQDHVWSILPKEFREEVKYEYSRVATKAIKSSYDLGFMHAHERMYGHHNLTSDAEGEDEMLHVSRKRVQDEFNSVKIITSEKICSKVLAGAADMYLKTLERLFGSKCLPDNVDSSEPNVDSLPQNPTENCDNKSHISADCNKPAEPKFKVGDKVRYRPSGNVYEVEGKTGRQHYALKGWLKDVLESDLEPYTRSNPNPSNSGELKL